MTDPDLSDASWFKSSHSQQGGNCVEVAADFPGVVPVRDSKDPGGPALVFSREAWAAFARSAAAGEFGEA
ncbi:DUF397 domain-containing protein [Kitasatospora sp. NPDC052896]|uniref:DUF397 domain-containing protein n=1 Tax=Kitasatospora sp. NPDC052896 TaxID=3364061 RepID=UPI0037C836BE